MTIRKPIPIVEQTTITIEDIIGYQIILAAIITPHSSYFIVIIYIFTITLRKTQYNILQLFIYRKVNDARLTVPCPVYVKYNALIPSGIFISEL